MNWKPVTEREYDPKPNPKVDAIPFVLTPAERDVAKIASLSLERHRRRQNERDLHRALERLDMQPKPPEAA